jgi:Tol biopolymer transport system component
MPFAWRVKVLSDRGDIYRVNADGSGLTAVTNGGYARFYALWPDGKELVIYDALGDRLVLLPASGEGAPAALVDKVSGHVPTERLKLSWSPDGKAIAFAGALMDSPTGGSPLYIVNADGSGLSKVPNAERVADIAWRPKWGEDPPDWLLPGLASRGLNSLLTQSRSDLH